jgi:hypothetical protein
LSPSAGWCAAVCVLLAHSAFGEKQVGPSPDERWARLSARCARLSARVPACYPPAAWGALEAEVRGLQAAFGRGARPKDRVASVEALESRLRALDDGCRTQAESRLEEARRRLRFRISEIDAALAAGILEEPQRALLESPLREARALAVAASDPSDAWQARDALAAGLEQATQRLTALARDPCEDDYRAGLLAASAGHAERARSLFANVVSRACLSAEIALDAAEQLAVLPRREPGVAPEPAPVVPEVPRPAPTLEVPKGTSRQARTSAPAPPVGDGQSRLTLDVWQSAWGDFSDLPALAAYARNNGIGSINLNPGLGIGEDGFGASHAKLAPIVAKLRAGGIGRIRFLYAELGYPIAPYAEFLRAHDDLGIDTLVDDSEFTDAQREHFADNLWQVRSRGLRYAAFVTVEGAGQSGVSDESRRWLIENADEAILMSYFSCALDGQKKDVGEYLRWADERGLRQRIFIAVLLGTKSFGRETSCEIALGGELPRFLAELQRWGSGFASFGGLVLETNERLPRADVRGRN